MLYINTIMIWISLMRRCPSSKNRDCDSGLDFDHELDREPNNKIACRLPVFCLCSKLTLSVDPWCTSLSSELEPLANPGKIYAKLIFKLEGNLESRIWNWGMYFARIDGVGRYIATHKSKPDKPKYLPLIMQLKTEVIWTPTYEYPLSSPLSTCND